MSSFSFSAWLPPRTKKRETAPDNGANALTNVDTNSNTESAPRDDANDANALTNVDTNSAAAALKPGCPGYGLNRSGAIDQSTLKHAPPPKSAPPPPKSAPPPPKPAPPSRERNTPSKPKTYGGNVGVENQQAGKTQSKVKFQRPSEANVRVFDSFTEEEVPNAIFSVEEESVFRAREESGNPPTPHSASPNDSMSRIYWQTTKAGHAKAEANKPTQESTLKIPMEKGADTPTKNAALFAANHNWSKSYSHKVTALASKKSDFDPSEYGILTVQQYEELDAETAVGDKEFLVADRFKAQLNNAYVEHVATTGSRAKSGCVGCFRSTLRDTFHIKNVSAFIEASMWDEWLLKGEELDRRVAAHKQQQIAEEAKPPAVELREALAPRVLYDAPPTPLQQPPPAVIPPPTPIDLMFQHHKQESDRRLAIDERTADIAEKESERRLEIDERNSKTQETFAEAFVKVASAVETGNQTNLNLSETVRLQEELRLQEERAAASTNVPVPAPTPSRKGSSVKRPTTSSRKGRGAATPSKVWKVRVTNPNHEHYQKNGTRNAVGWVSLEGVAPRLRIGKEIHDDDLTEE